MKKVLLVLGLSVIFNFFVQAQDFRFLNVPEKIILSHKSSKNVDSLYVLDSLVVNVFIFQNNFYFVVPYYIMYFQYDQNLNILDFKTSVLIGTRYDTVMHTFYRWDSANRLIEKRILALDSLGGNRKYNYFYDSLNRLVSVLYQKYTDTVWFNYRLDSLFYQKIDSQQWVVEVKKQYLWDDSLRKWTPDVKFEYNFDTLTGLPVSTTVFYWSSDAWTPAHLDSIVYGVDSLKSNEQFFTWNNSLSAWSLDSEYVFDYDENKNLIRKQLLVVTDTDTIVERQMIYGYDESNNLKVDTLLVYSPSSHTLQYVKNTYYAYDSRSNLRLMVIQNWDTTQSQWVNYRKHLVKCDTLVPADDVVLPEDLDLGLYLNNKLNEVYVYKWDSDNNMWIYFYKYELFYTKVLTSVSDLPDLVIYPNPVREVLFVPNPDFVGANVMIYNLNGQVVMTKRINRRSINVSHLSPGIYILVVEKGGKRLVTKFIKQ